MEPNEQFCNSAAATELAARQSFWGQVKATFRVLTALITLVATVVVMSIACAMLLMHIWEIMQLLTYAGGSWLGIVAMRKMRDNWFNTGS